MTLPVETKDAGPEMGMVERVARVIYPDIWRLRDKIELLSEDARRDWWAQSPGFGETLQVSQRKVRSAIAAMRAPTIEMLASAPDEVSGKDTLATWQAMIDSTLNETR